MKPEKFQTIEESLAVVIQPLLHHIAAQLSAKGCLILMRDAGTENYLIVSITNAHILGPGSVVRPDEDMVSRVAISRAPLIVNNYREWSGRSLDLRPDQLVLDAYLCVPLLWQGEYLGGLVISSYSNERQFTAEDIPALEVFSPLIAALLSHCNAQGFHPDYEEHVRQEVNLEVRELIDARRKMAEDADQLRNLLADTVVIQEEERSRIASDLHDGSNQLVIGAIYEIQVAQQRLTSGRVQEATESLETAKSLLRRIEAENRVLINGLRPTLLNNHGLAVTIKWHLENFCERHGFIKSFEVIGQPQRLPESIEIAIFRIVQESLNNSLEHASASKLSICLEFQENSFDLVVEDDGCGFDQSKISLTNQSHFGLIGLRERALSIGAQLEIRSAPGQGTKLLLHVPVTKSPEDPMLRFEQRHNMRIAYTYGLQKKQDKSQ